MKIFTFFELTTVSLLFFLVNVFDRVDLFKPDLSKEGNSEVYDICNGYQRVHKNICYVSEMANRMPATNVPILPEDFIEQVAHFTKMLMLYQVKAIPSNINNFQGLQSDQEQPHNIQYEMINEYCRRYRVKSIPNEMKLFYGKPPINIRQVIHLHIKNTVHTQT